VDEPDHWHRVTGAPVDAPAAVFDLDGVIADAGHRQSYLRGGRRDWDGFFRASEHDPVLDAGAALAASIDDAHTVVILTGRPDSIRTITIDWLTTRSIRHDLLIMRPPGDRRSAVDFKRDELRMLRALGATLSLCLDDSRDNVAMMRSLDVPTLYVHSGYYDDGPSG